MSCRKLPGTWQIAGLGSGKYQRGWKKMGEKAFWVPLKTDSLFQELEQGLQSCRSGSHHHPQLSSCFSFSPSPSESQNNPPLCFFAQRAPGQAVEAHWMLAAATIYEYWCLQRPTRYNSAGHASLRSKCCVCAALGFAGEAAWEDSLRASTINSRRVQFGLYIETAADVIIFLNQWICAGDEEPSMANRREKKNIWHFICLTRAELWLANELRAPRALQEAPVACNKRKVYFLYSLAHRETKLTDKTKSLQH